MTTDTLAKLAAELAQLASEGPALIHLQSGAYICRKLGESAKALTAQALHAAEPDDGEQSAFEAWLSDECPSGDIESVQRKWESSSAFADWQAAQQAAQAHCKKCDKCGNRQSDGWALYCVDCLEKTGLLAKEALPSAQHVSSTAADLTGPNNTTAQATTGAATTGGGVTTGAPSEPFGYFKAQPFGWTDCAETDDGAVALYERPQQAAQAPAGWREQHDRDSDELRSLCQARDVARKQRDHARACYDSAVKLLTGIHALLYPAPITVPDGRTMVFRPKDPDPHAVLQELSDRIRALPDALAALSQPPQPQSAQPEVTK